MPFVSASIYRKARRLALSEGLPPDLLAHHERNMELHRGAKYLPIELLYEAYELADQHLAPGFAVRQGRQLHSEDYGTLGLAWRTCWRAREIFERVARYVVLVTDQGSVEVQTDEQLTTVALIRDAHRRGLEMANETTFVMITGILHEVTGKEIHPVSAQFKHASQDTANFEAFFQCPVSFGRDAYAIQFRTPDIDIPTLKADHNIQQFLVERMEEEKQGIEANADRLLEQIHQLVEESLPSGIPSVTQVAEYLGMSDRTLKRRLAERGQTFRDVVQKIQRDVSVNLLRNSSRSMGEIAFQTGFSEQSAFNRAFKRWAGQSPVDYRKSA